MRQTALALALALADAPILAAGLPFDKNFRNAHLADYAGRGFEWENNRLGVTEDAPAPWSPVAVEGRRVTLTHRHFTLGTRDGGAAIEQIVSRDTPLLAGGLRVTLTDGAGTAHDLTLEAEPVTAKDAAAVFRGHTGLPGGRATLDLRAEFDGFLHFRLDLEPEAGKALEIRDLRVTALLRREAASHYKFLVPYNFTTEESGEGKDGRPPSTDALERELRLPFSPMLWLGTPQAGLEWLCETDHGWSLEKPLDAVRIEPGAEVVTWTNQLVNRPVTLDRPAHHAFAFNILPMRPAPLRDWDVDGIVVNSDPVLDYKEALAPWRTVFGVHRNTSPTPGHPVARGRTLTARLRHFGMNLPWEEGPHARRYQEERAELRGKGIRYLPYTILHGLPSDLPSDTAQVDKTWLEQWDLRTAKEGHRHYFFISHHHKSSIDFQLYHAIRTIREHGLDGQYFDLAQPRAAVGYARRMTEDFGRDSFYMPIFGYREFSKRFYIASTEINPGFLIIQHAVVPTGISSAYSVSSGGEHLKQFFGGGHRTHRIDEEGRTVLASDPAEFDPDYFRVPDMMHPVGNWFPVFGQTLSFTDFMKGTGGYFTENPDRRSYYARTFLARSLTHGLHVWWRHLDTDLALPILRTFDRFGPRAATARVHDALAEKRHLINEDKSLFAYRIETKPDRVLLIASNGGETAEAHFDLGGELGGGAAGWVFENGETGEPVAHEGGRFSVAIPKHDFRIVIGSRKKP